MRDRIGATLRLDPNRLGEQTSFVVERAKIVRAFGDRVWTNITPEQAERFREVGITVEFHDDAYLLDLPAVLFDPLEDEEPRPPDHLSALLKPGEPAYYLVQFVAPPEPDWIGALEELGAEYAGDAPQLAALFRMTPEQAEAARALVAAEQVRWLGPYHPLYALDYRLAGRETPFSAADLPSAQVDPSEFVEGGRLTVQVTFFDGLTTGQAVALVEAAGGTDITDTGHSVVADIDPENLTLLLGAQGVRSVEPYREPGPATQRAGVIIGANQVRNFGKVDFLVNLDGSGEIVGVLDTGIDPHDDFKDPATGASRVLSIGNINTPPARPTTDHYPHGNHVVGCIAGNGAVARGTLPQPATIPRGIAPAAQIVFDSVNLSAPVASGKSNSMSYRRYLNSIKRAYRDGARVHNNSWSNQNRNVYTQGNSLALDAYAFTHPDMLILFAAGNAEDDANNNGVLDMNFLGEHSIPKNILCIGACENETSVDGEQRNYRNTYGQWMHAQFAVPANAATAFSMSDSADDLALFSNRGRVTNPAAPGTGRVKPDLVAPGTNIMATRPPAANNLEWPLAAGSWQDPLTAPAAAYYVEHGTSMATPIAAGAALLVRQFYRQRLSRLRRPQLVASLGAVTDPAPPVVFVGAPAAAPQPGGFHFFWVRHAAAAPAQNNIEAARFSRRLVRAADAKVLFTDVGDHPAPSAARHGDKTFLLHRGKDSKLNLTLFDKDLAPVKSFNTTGTVTPATESRDEDTRRPAVCVQSNDVTLVWVRKGTDELVFQRFEADTGKARDASPKTLGAATNTAPHPYLVHTGALYAAVWVRSDAGQHALLLRTVGADGKVEGDKPLELVAPQPLELREAQAVWDARHKQLVVAWVEEWVTGECRMLVQRVKEDGTTLAPPETVVDTATEVPAPLKKNLRRPRLVIHPEKGYVLFYESDRQGTHDLYLTFLDGDGKLDKSRLAEGFLQASDTPKDTEGFAALADAEGVTPLWQSEDEINSDLYGVYALNVTAEGAFEAQVDPNTPLLRDGRYVAHLLREHGDTTLTQMGMAWAGGEQYTLRTAPNPGVGAVLEILRANADGKPDAGGPVTLHRADAYLSCSLHWTGQHLLAACSTLLASHVFLLNGEGREVGTFGPFGVALAETPAPGVHIQCAQTGSGKNWRAFAAYGQAQGPGPHRLRLVVLDEEGKTPGSAAAQPADFTRGKKPVLADGTARHGWFHVVPTETPVHLIAAWHRGDAENGGRLVVELNRFRLDGRSQAGVAEPFKLTAIAGDSCNAVIAPRPVLFDLTPPAPANAAALSRQRVFGVAWQNRPAHNAPWEIRFSELRRNGDVSKTTKDVPVVQKAGQHCTDPQLVWHTDGYGLAWLQQDSTKDGAPRRLFFNIFDEKGAPVSLPPNVVEKQLSADDADVQSFRLVWNGRAFRVTWVEVAGGKLRQRQTALMVPRLRGGAPFNEPFKQPSAALVRATLVNGATNSLNRALPSLGTGPNDGYGWGRINLRQSLAPTPPATFHARDDAAVEAGRTARYEFSLPPKTALLRVTLAWTDPPHRNVVNNLNLRVTAPASGAAPARVYVGNRWQTGPLAPAPPATPTSGPPFSDPLPPNLDPKIDPFDKVYTVEQIVIHEPPEGTYLVEVLGGAFKSNMYMQQPGQPFSLVFVGSGPEVRTARKMTAAPQAIY
ncbi:MAG TPA: S8 family serine peptidase [Pyrinomonadaceae bacterium]|nr:S8 family serine peptidase [Pyrinomonadaceae bacterium]